MMKSSLFGLAAGAALFTAMPVSVEWSTATIPTVSLDQAAARIGRPLTPMSVAGVHRRAYRRGYYGGGLRPRVGFGLGMGALAAGAAAAPYYGGYSSPYYGYSGYYPSYGYGGPYAAYGRGYYRPHVYHGYGWRRW
jgi:hypothetical protein